MTRLIFGLGLTISLVGGNQVSAGSLNFGNMADPTGHQIDTYLIHIENPTVFLAGLLKNTSPLSANGWVDFDAIMYLFDFDGTAIAAVKGAAGQGVVLASVSQGGQITNLTEGLYKLVVTSFDNQAFDSSNNNLFTQPIPTTSFGNATKAPGVGPLDHFTQEGTYPGEPLTGEYSITLGGAAFTPEPATLTLLAIGIAGMGGYGWRRRKQAELGA